MLPTYMPYVYVIYALIDIESRLCANLSTIIRQFVMRRICHKLGSQNYCFEKEVSISVHRMTPPFICHLQTGGGLKMGGHSPLYV